MDMKEQRAELMKSLKGVKEPRERAEILHKLHTSRTVEEIIVDLLPLCEDEEIFFHDLIDAKHGPEVQKKLFEAGASQFEIDTLIAYYTAQAVIIREQIEDSRAIAAGMPLPKRPSWTEIEIEGVNCREIN